MIYVLPIFIDLLIGDPFGYFHPIVLIGNIISLMKSLLYKDSRLRGFIFLFAVILSVLLPLMLVLSFLSGWIYRVIVIYLIYALLATKSLYVESKKVIDNIDDIDEARKYLSYIVGRDTSSLTSQQILKATIETISENTIDGALAPLFYLSLGIFLGFPIEILVLYKTVNTLDSMVGYKNEKYQNFGYASAKLDDLLNFIPARIGSLIMLVSGLLLRLDFIQGFKVFKRDRLKHASPNAGHPESVIAGLLNIRLGGLSSYFGKIVQKPFIGEGNQEVNLRKVYDSYKVLFLSVLITTLIIVIWQGGLYEISTAWS